MFRRSNVILSLFHIHKHVVIESRSAPACQQVCHMDQRAEVQQAELDQYGIERVPADAFLWGGYRYSNARDAVAAAQRAAQK